MRGMGQQPGDGLDYKVEGRFSKLRPIHSNKSEISAFHQLPTRLWLPGEPRGPGRRDAGRRGAGVGKVRMGEAMDGEVRVGEVRARR